MAEQYIKNPSITPGDLNIELSGRYVTAISGYAIGGTGGGGGPSVVYSGVVGEITVDNQQGTIGIADEIKNSINSKASKVELNTTYNTLNEAKQDKLTFGYDDTAISSINGSAIAGTGGGDYTAGIDLKIENGEISVDTNGNPNNTASNTRNFVEGSWTVASGYMNHAEGVATSALGYGVHAQGMWTKFSSNDGQLKGGGTGPIYWAAGAGATVEGYCNATTSCPMSGTEGQEDYGPIHGGVLKVIGNGYVENEDHETDVHVPHPSDALIIFKDGTISAFGDIYKNDKKFITEGNFAQGNAYAMTTSGWEAIQAGGQGIQQVLHDDTLDGDGATSTSLLRVDTTKIQPVSGMTAYATTTLLDSVSGELKELIPTDLFTKASADTLYQPKGNYVSANEIDDMATETWVEGKHYLISDDISGKADKTQLADYLTTAQYQTDSATFVTETELEAVSGEITALIPTNYVTSGNYISGNSQYALTSGGWAKVQAGSTLTPGSGIDIVSNEINVKLGKNLKFTNSNNTVITTEDNLSANSFGVYTSENYYTKINQYSITKYYKSVGESGDEIDTVSLNPIGLETIFTGPNRNITANYDVNHLFFKSYDNNGEYSGNYSQIEMKVLQEQNPAATQHKSTIELTDYDGTNLKTGLIDVDSIAAWNAATGGSFTGVTTNDTLTGDGTGDNNKLGVAWSALSSNTIDYSNSAFNLTNGTSVSSFNQISAAIDSKLNKTLSFNVGTGNTVVDDGKCIVMGNRSYVSGNSVSFCDDNTAKDNSLAFGWGSSAKLYSFAGGYHCSADTYSISLAHENIATGHSISIGHANTAYNYAGAIGRGLSIDGGDYGALAVGRWNNISSNALFVVGNGSGNGSYRSDAVVVDRSGNTEIYGSLTVDVSTGKNVLAVATAASLIGASRQTSAHYGVDNTALGTTWVGVGGAGMHQGFIKYTDGGDVGALDSNSMIQLNFKPSTNNFDSIQVQINNNHVGYLIPAVTATTTAGLTDDGILHIIIES